MGCRRRDSAKVPKCTRTDTDTTADPLNLCNCFQTLQFPEQTWRGVPRPFRHQVLIRSDLFASSLTMSRCTHGHICILNICFPSTIHPPFVRPDPPTHPPTLWLVVVGANAGQTIPSRIRDGSSAVPEHECARTSSAEHSQDKQQPPAAFLFSDFCFLIFRTWYWFVF